MNPSMARVRRLIARSSCSTRLLGYLDWRIKDTRRAAQKKARQAKNNTRDQTKKKNEATPALAFGAQ
ncbi:hypothetical protein [Paraburkholderia xenovorans]|uniref:hypothetical protein n=1 Tax=Paraburkholderia xenovorans TaxID=36873 RepID=UPI0038B82DDE